MKTKEFNQEVAKLGFVVSPQERNTYIECDGVIIAKVSRLYTLVFSTHFAEFSDLQSCDQNKIFDLCTQLAKTPLTEREEEKRYRVKFPAITRGGNAIYLQRETSHRDPIGIDWSEEGFIYNEEPDSYIFTEQEIKDINGSYWEFAEEVTE